MFPVGFRCEAVAGSLPHHPEGVCRPHMQAIDYYSRKQMGPVSLWKACFEKSFSMGEFASPKFCESSLNELCGGRTTPALFSWDPQHFEQLSFPVVQLKNWTSNAGDSGLIPGLGN